MLIDYSYDLIYNLNYTEIIVFNHRMQILYNRMESALKNTVVFWENIQERLVKMNKIHQLGGKIILQLDTIYQNVLDLMQFDHDFDYLKLTYQVLLLLEYRQEQFRLEVIGKSLDKNFNKIDKIVKYNG